MAEEPLRKWPSSERVLRSRCSLRRVSGEILAVHCGRGPTYRLVSILTKVLSAWEKKSYTMLLLNSRSSSSSSISRICSNVAASMLSLAPEMAMMPSTPPSSPFLPGVRSCLQSTGGRARGGGGAKGKVQRKGSKERFKGEREIGHV